MPYKRIYLERQPQIGDTIVATRDSSVFNSFVKGYEYEVVTLGNGYVGAIGDRTNGRIIAISDNAYDIYEDIYFEEPKLKETHIKVYRFLGIPFLKRKTYVYK